VKARTLSLVEYGIFVHVRDGIEGLIPQNELVLVKDEATGEEVLPKVGDEVEAEIANIDSQERRLTLSMRKGEAAAAAAPGDKASTRPSKAPKKTSAAEAAAGGTIGELIKQKLGAKLAQMNSEKKDDDEDESSE
jgi:small subunit ribosomal protein S1